jgi:hypothetical protein
MFDELVCLTLKELANTGHGSGFRFFHRPVEYDNAAVEHEHPVGDFADGVEFVGHDNESDADEAPEIENQIIEP